MYCTLADLLDRVPESVIIDCTDDEGAGQVNTNRVDQAIGDAGSEIDGYCMARYPLPFDPAPAVIKKLCTDIALYNLMSRRGFDEEKGSDRVVQDRYRSAVRVLENMAKGIVTLGAPTPPAVGTVEISGPGRVFSRAKLRDM